MTFKIDNNFLIGVAVGAVTVFLLNKTGVLHANSGTLNTLNPDSTGTTYHLR